MAYRKWVHGGRRRKTERDKYMTAEELGRFLAAAKADGPEYHALWVIQANLGLRITEALSLRREDFSHLDEGIVKIRTLKQKGSEGPVDVIYVEDATVRFIRGYLAKLPGARKWLFQSGENPISRQAAWEVFCKVVERAGLNRAYSPHSLRHYRGVALWESTKDLQFVRSQLRHRSIQSTMIYMHMSPQTQKALVRKVRSVL